MTGDSDGVPDSDPRHIDPAGEIADHLEEHVTDVELTGDTDREDLAEFIEAAEAGEFGADPGVEANVRVARVLLEAIEPDDD